VIEGYREKCETKTVLGARFAKHPIELDIDLHHRHELRRAVARGEDGAREGPRWRGRRRARRGRDDPPSATCRQVVLPEHPEPLRLQPAPPDARRRVRVLHRPGMQGRARRAPDGSEGHGAGGRDASLPAGIVGALPHGTPTGWGRTTSRSRCRRSARRPTTGSDPAEARRGRVYDDVRMAAKCGPDIIYLDGAEARRARAAHRGRGDGHPADGRDPRRVGPRGRRLADEIDLVVAGGSQRRRRRQVHRARRDGDRDRHRRPDGAQLHKEIPGCDYMGTVGVPAVSATTATREVPGRDRHPGSELRKRLDVGEGRSASTTSSPR
jgi:hypothetical protein